MDKIRWGILAPGRIARKFVTGLKSLPDAELAAVGSRDLGRAQAFAKEFGAARAYGSYEELARDPGVDIVYVASPHTGHCAHTLLCIEQGKAVLCEKPFTVNAREAARVIEAARQRSVLAIEAMWTRFLPTFRQAREWIAAGRIGRVRMVMADFGFDAPFHPHTRVFDPALAGGGLLDVGVYPISFASMAFGGAEPDRVTGLADVGQSGVDEQAAMVLGYGAERLAVLACGVRTQTPQVAHIIGSEGEIEFPYPCWKSTVVRLLRTKEEPVTREVPHPCNGFEYEAQEAMRCLREGLKESPLMPLDETLGIMRTMDRLREQWGVKYPGE